MTSKYKVQFNKKYLKDLEKIPQRFQKQIHERIQQLSIDPRPVRMQKVKRTG